MPGNEASFEIQLNGDHLSVFVNEKDSLRTSVPSSRVSGNGLYFKTGGGWRGWNNGERTVAVKDFSVTRTIGYLPRSSISPEDRLALLTLPKDYSGSSDLQLLEAQNGDLLRGELISYDGEKLRFAAQGQEVALDRSLLRTLICVSPRASKDSGENAAEEDHPPAALDFQPASWKEKTLSHKVRLMNGSRLLLCDPEPNGEFLTALSPVIGTIRVPASQVHRVEQFLPVTVADVLRELPSIGAFAYKDWAFLSPPEPMILDQSAPVSPLIDKPAPDFQLPILQMSAVADQPGSVTLDDLLGEVTILEFWASWSAPGVQSLPKLPEIVNRFPERDIKLLAINQGESGAALQTFLRLQGLEELPVALDTRLEVTQAYRANTLPCTMVLDRDGIIRHIIQGSRKDLEETLLQVIGAILTTQDQGE